MYCNECECSICLHLYECNECANCNYEYCHHNGCEDYVEDIDITLDDIEKEELG